MATEQRYFLNESDKGLLDEVIADYLRRNPPPVPRRPKELGQAPEVLLVRTPEGGIPALSTAGTTGTSYEDAEDDTPGAADCPIYTAVEDDNGTGTDLPTFSVQRIPNRTILVVNMSTVALPAGQWLLAHRDRFGTWFAGNILGLEFTEC